MIDDFSKIKEMLNDSDVKFKKDGFQNIFKNYSFLNISEISALKENEEQLLSKNIKKSKTIIVDHFNGHNDMIKKKISHSWY